MREWRKIILSLGHFAPPIDFWLDQTLGEIGEWCDALNELLEPKEN